MIQKLLGLMVFIKHIWTAKHFFHDLHAIYKREVSTAAEGGVYESK